MNGFDEAWLSDYQAQRAAQTVPAAKPVYLEWQGQETIAEFLDLALPAEAFWSSIDMGPASSKKVGGLRKKRGLKAGLPDMIIVFSGITLWLELKAPGGTLSAAQRKVRFALLANDHHWALARSIDDVVVACAKAHIPLLGDVGGAA